MVEKFHFFPLIKMKRSERSCLKKSFNLFSGDNITPYLELLLEKGEDGKADISSVNSWLADFLEKKPSASLVIEFFHGKSLLTRAGAEKVGNHDYLSLQNGNKLYLNDTESLFDYPAAVPCYVVDQITINNPENFTHFIQMGHNKKTPVGLRIDITGIIDFSFLSSTLSQLTSDDFLFLDFKKDSYSKKMALVEEQILKKGYKAKISILSDDRPSKTNSSYNHSGYDKEVKDGPSIINMDNRNASPTKPQLYGFGGYCGAKNNLDSGGSSNNKMYALALIYDDSKRMFYSIVSESGRGQQDYADVKKEVLKQKALFDQDGKCPAYKFIEDKKEPGGWTTWILFGIIRYIDQMRRYLVREKEGTTPKPSESDELFEEFLQANQKASQQE